jgi:2-keto-4-pentenoate hydratase/2-oxohepta-3-ene-1,7-dioic acid hydratase in catechol pathway
MKRNGEIVQSARTSDMIFSVDEILAYLDSRIPLKPGDVVFTGTPSGVIVGRPSEERNWLKPGEILEASIEGIGTLRTKLG